MNVCFNVSGFLFYLAKDRINDYIPNSLLGVLLRNEPEKDYFELDVDYIGFAYLHRYILLGAGKEKMSYYNKGHRVTEDLSNMYLSSLDKKDQLITIYVANVLSVDLKHIDYKIKYDDLVFKNN